MNLQDLISALACAVAMLDGSGGGYSPDERKKSKNVLQQLYQQKMDEWKASN